MKTFLVTGGAGFIGSHLIEALVARKDVRVLSLDNYFTGKRENHIPGAEYIEGDTRNIQELIKVKPNIVFHLGEYSRVEKSFDDVQMVWEYNKDGTFAVLEFCRNCRAKLVYAGSSTKFGDGGLGRDQSPYAWTKATNTELVKNYHDWFGLSYAIAYFYNVYGPKEIDEGAYATVIGIFKRQYRCRKPLTVVEPGNQLRNFTHVKDIVNGLIKIGEVGEGDNYGLGARDSHQILEVAKMFNSDIVMLPPRPGNRLIAELDVSRSETELGWQATESLREHIQEFIKKS